MTRQLRPIRSRARGRGLGPLLAAAALAAVTAAGCTPAPSSPSASPSAPASSASSSSTASQSGQALTIDITIADGKVTPNAEKIDAARAPRSC